MKQSYKKSFTVILLTFLITLAFSQLSFAEDTGTGVSTGAGKLVAQYKFDGDFKDSSGNGHDAAAVGSVQFSNDGVLGQCAEFNGGSLQVADNPDMQLTGPYTVSAWIKMNPESREQNAPVISKTAKNGVDSDYIMFAENSTNFKVWMAYDNGEGSGYTEAQTYSQDLSLVEDWSLVTATNDGNIINFYVNGELKASTQVPKNVSVTTSSNNVLIGAFIQSNVNRYFKGKMDDLRIYNYALSDPEIKALYNAAGVYNHKIVLHLENPMMMVDDVQKEIDPGKGTSPIVINGRTMVPIRAVIEAMGGTLTWTAKEQRLEITLKSKQLQLWVNRTTANLDGKQLTLDVPPTIINNRTMVPLRFVSENLGCKVEWDKATQKITILYSK